MTGDTSDAGLPCANLILVGFGNVAQRFVRLLEELRPRLDWADGRRGASPLPWRVVGIATRRHGLVHDDTGIDVTAALGVMSRGERLDRLSPTGTAAPRDALELIQRATSHLDTWNVVVETTVLDVNAGQPAIDHVRAAIAAGADVITANKGPAAFAYEELRASAALAGVAFRFEGAVMDGVPIFNLVRETLPAVEVQGFRGVVNTTTNHILVAMEQGRPFSEALADMQAAGIAEADASLDIDGWDAAAKVAALANVWLDARITPHQVVRTGISRVTADDVSGAVARGNRLKLVGRGRRGRGGVEAVVEPVELPGSDLLAGLAGDENALVVETDVMGDIAIAQLTSGLTQTAYALVSDLVSIARQSRRAVSSDRTRG